MNIKNNTSVTVNNPSTKVKAVIAIVMTILGIPGDFMYLSVPHFLPLRKQRARMVEHSSLIPDGIPTYKVTLCDLMMHVPPLLWHMLSKRTH